MGHIQTVGAVYIDVLLLRAGKSETQTKLKGDRGLFVFPIAAELDIGARPLVRDDAVATKLDVRRQPIKGFVAHNKFR